MTCEEQQQRISALIDAEVSPEEARPIFQHLAECGECRTFHHRLVALANTLDRSADLFPAAGLPDALRKRSAGLTYPGRWWHQRVSIGAPALALILCMILGGIYLTVRYVYQSQQGETVFVTKLPTVVITAGGGKQ